jgi:hypothetical protein
MVREMEGVKSFRRGRKPPRQVLQDGTRFIAAHIQYITTTHTHTDANTATSRHLIDTGESSPRARVHQKELVLLLGLTALLGRFKLSPATG